MAHGIWKPKQKKQNTKKTGKKTGGWSSETAFEKRGKNKRRIRRPDRYEHWTAD